MGDVKWIKIATDIFDDEKIMLIEASGDDCYAIITVWFKLLCLAGKQNNGGIFMLNDKLAYNEEMLATIFRMKSTTIRKALDMFEEFGMIERIEGVVSIPNWNKHQSLEKLEKQKKLRNDYMKKYMKAKRESEKTASKNNVSANVNANVTKMLTDVNSLDIDKDIEEENKNKELSKESDIGYIAPTFEEIKKYCSEKKYSFNINKFYCYYSSRGWEFNNTNKKIVDWKSLCDLWETTEKDFKNKSPNKDIDLEDWQIDGMNEIMEDFKNEITYFKD